MRKAILLLIVFIIGLSANADYVVQPYSPYYQPPINTYTNEYDPNSSYQIQNQQQCINPYAYGRYRYRNNLLYPGTNPLLYGANVSGNQGILRNIGQSLLYSMMRGY